MKIKYYILILLTILFSLFAIKKATAQIQFNQDEDKYVSIWTDPTLSDNGFQIGGTFTMEYKAVFAEYSISHYNELNPSYTDIVVGYGLVLNVFKADLYIGGRLGFIYREKDNIAGLTGGMMRLQYPVTKRLYLGIQFWIDARTDLGNDFVRENGGFYVSFRL